MEHAKRFRAMLAELGLSHPDAAKLLHISLRTLQNWLSGRHEVPYASYKLLRLLRHAELPGDAWRGWSFSRGLLITPEGRTITGSEGAWWSLLVRQARCFQAAYRRSGEFERALMELAATGAVSKGPSKLDRLMESGASSSRPKAVGRAGAKRPLDLSNKHFGTSDDEFTGLRPSRAMETIAPIHNVKYQEVQHG